MWYYIIADILCALVICTVVTAYEQRREVV